MEQKALQIGAAALAMALLLRIGSTEGAASRELARTLVFLGSGRLVTETVPLEEEEIPTLQTQPATAPTTPPTTPPTEQTLPTEPVEESPAVPTFGQSDLNSVQVNASWSVDTLSLLRKPLSWELKAEKPTVLILHTHGTESYEKEPGYRETSPYRTLDTDYNLVSVGAAVADILEKGGIRVIHDTTLHDYPSYNAAYSNARKTIKKHLKANPSILLVLDLHRDAAEGSDGRQTRTAVTIDGEKTAQLMLVMGSDKGSLSYPNWEKNLSLAVKLQAQLESSHPGLCRPIKLASKRYNQDLCPGTLLVEVGTAGDTHREALNGAKYLAEAILALANGANR